MLMSIVYMTLVLLVVKVEFTMPHERIHEMKPVCKHHSGHHKQHRAVHPHSKNPLFDSNDNMSEEEDEVNETELKHKPHPVNHRRKKVIKHWARSQPWKKLNDIFKLNQPQRKPSIHRLMTSNSTPRKHDIVVALINPLNTNFSTLSKDNVQKVDLAHTESFEPFDNQENAANYDATCCKDLKKDYNHEDDTKQKCSTDNDVHENKLGRNVTIGNNLRENLNVSSDPIEAVKGNEIAHRAIDMNCSNLNNESNSAEMYRQKPQVIIPKSSKFQPKIELHTCDKSSSLTTQQVKTNGTHKSVECGHVKTIAEVVTKINSNLLDSIQPQVKGGEIDKFGAVKDLNLLRLNVSDIVRIETKISVKKNVNTSDCIGNKIEASTHKYVITNLKVEKDNVMDHLDEMVKQSSNKVMLMDKAILDEYLSKKASNGTLQCDNPDSHSCTHKSKLWILLALIAFLLLICFSLRFVCRDSTCEKDIRSQSDEEKGQKKTLIRFKDVPTCISPRGMYKTFDSCERASKTHECISTDNSHHSHYPTDLKTKRDQCENMKYDKHVNKWCTPDQMKNKTKRDQCENMKYDKHYSSQHEQDVNKWCTPDQMKNKTYRKLENECSPMKVNKADQYFPLRKVNPYNECDTQPMHLSRHNQYALQHLKVSRHDTHSSGVHHVSVEHSNHGPCSSRTRKLVSEFKKYEGSLYKDFSDSLNHKRNKLQHKYNAMVAKNRRESVGDELHGEIDLEEEYKEKELDIYNYEPSNNWYRPNSILKENSKKKYWRTHQKKSNVDRMNCKKLGSKSRKFKSNRIQHIDTKSEFS